MQSDHTHHAGLRAKWSLSSNAFWTVLDQALASGSVFVINLLLANWMTGDEYGAFSIAFATFALAATVHTGLITEPMMVFGRGRFHRRWPTYQRFLQRSHWWLTGALAVGLLAIGMAVSWRHSVLGWSIIGLGIAIPGLLYVWLARFAAYAAGRALNAVAVSASHLVLLVPTVILLKSVDRLTGGMVFVCMGVTGLPAAWWMLRRSGESPTTPSSLRFKRVILARHWRYGRWATVSGLLMAVPLSGPILILSFFASLDAVASVRAAINLLIPISRFNTALGVSFLPSLSRLARRNDARLFQRSGVMLLLALSGVSLLYGGAMIVMPQRLMGLFYGDAYIESAYLLIPLGIGACCSGAAVAIATLLRAREHTRWIAYAQFLTAVVTLAVAIPASRWLGAYGAAIAMTAAMVSQALILLIQFISLRARARP